MSEIDYTPNSHKYKAEQQNPEKKKVTKVIKGTAKVKKKNELTKLADVFISEDVKNVKSYVLGDVLVPAIKKAIVDIVTDGINMIFYGGTGRGRSSVGSKVSYRSFYDKREDDRRSFESTRSRSIYNYDSITLDSRGEAEAVLEQLCDLIETYGKASVADLFDLVGVSHNYTDDKYGWTNLSNATTERVRDGYILKLPRAIPINK